jgi:hypothetical protein
VSQSGLEGLAKRLTNLSGTVYLIVILLGLVVGLIVARWSALVLAIGLGVWITLNSEVEVPPWFLGTVYAALAGMGIAAGVSARKLVARR